MLILGDENQHPGGVPWVTWSLIGINLLAFVAQLGIGDRFTQGFALIPLEISQGKDLVKPQQMKVKQAYVARFQGPDYGKTYYREHWITVPQAPGPFPIHLTLFTSMFLHAGWMHLIGNMWFLFVFGRNIEMAMRPGLFLAFYVTCGIVAGLADVIVDPESVIPCVGASGAISGVLGAYFFIYPFNKVRVWLGLLVGVIEVPAVVVLGIWLFVQYISTSLAITQGLIHGGTAYWSHLGGFVTGIVFVVVTLFYLRHQAAVEEQGAFTDEIADDAPMSMQEVEEEQPDPFGTFLPK